MDTDTFASTVAWSQQDSSQPLSSLMAQLQSRRTAAIARRVVLANQPKLLLADEPTGELDSVTAGEIFALMHTLNRDLGLTIITVTHDVALATVVDRTIAIRDGRTSTETIRRDAPLETVEAHTANSSAIIGLPSETHRESVLIDRVGRLQLPKEALERIPFNGRAEVRIAGDHVELWPLDTDVNGKDESAMMQIDK